MVHIVIFPVVCDFEVKAVEVEVVVVVAAIFVLDENQYLVFSIYGN